MRRPSRPAAASVVAVMIRDGSWCHGSPEEALEALVTEALLPGHWLEEGRRPCWEVRDGCFSPSMVQAPDVLLAARRYDDGDRWTADVPLTSPCLLSVASLGRAAIDGVESVVEEAWPSRQLVWRVAPAEELLAHHRSRSRVGLHTDVARSLSSEMLREHNREVGSPHASKERAWDVSEPPYEYGVRVANRWRHLCALADAGVHFIRSVPKRRAEEPHGPSITIGVEAWDGHEHGPPTGIGSTR